MVDRFPKLPTSVRYPVDRLIQKFSIDYFTSTVAYMFAWATDYIDQRVEAQLKTSPGNGLASAYDVMQLQRSLYEEWSVGIFGIDLIVGEEYDWQRACAEFWLGQMLARNITVIIPKESALLKQRYRYGYFMEPDDLLKDSDISKRIGQLTQEHQKHSEVRRATGGRTQRTGNYPRIAPTNAGLHVLADKPMIIDAKDFETLKQSFESAGKNYLLLYDIMTERYEITTMLQREFSLSNAVFGTLEEGTPGIPL